MGNDFVTLFEALAISSGNVETLKIDDSFMKFDDSLMLTTAIFQDNLEENSVQGGHRALPGLCDDFQPIWAPIFNDFGSVLATFSLMFRYFLPSPVYHAFSTWFSSISFDFIPQKGRVDLVSTETESANRE